jgi:hypothetical protein
MEGISYIYGKAQTGYAYKKSKIELPSQENGSESEENSEQTVRNHGVVFLGDLSLGLKGGAESKEGSRMKYELSIVNPQISVLGGSGGSYLRLSLDLGPKEFFEVGFNNEVRIFAGGGVVGRLEHTIIKPAEEENISVGGWNIVFPLAFGIGPGRFLLRDQLELIIELSPSFKLTNEVELNYRAYADYKSGFVDSLDIYAAYVYEFGKIGDDVEVRNNLLSTGLRVAF